MKSYLTLVKSVFATMAVYRVGLFFTLIGNLLYMVLIYFLWRSIYSGAEMIRGMTFNQAFAYLALASSIFVLLKTWTEWDIMHRIADGSVIVDLIKPLDFQLQVMSRSLGFALGNLMLITVPSILALVLLFGVEIDLGIGLFFFPVGLFMAFLISFNLDYAVGLTSFYTESLWGISMTKEIVTSLLSGSLVPLQFFPQAAQRVLRLLPFQAIYHIPLTMVTTPNLGLPEYARMLSTQALWVVVLFALSRSFYRQAIKVLTVSGG
jgi:ABC-2 type transport system permease protein